MTLHEEIILSFIDTGLIGIAILIGGFLLNRGLERYKTNQSLREELAKKQIEALVPLLNEIATIRGKLDYFLWNSGEQSRRGKADIVLAYLENISSEVENDTRLTLTVKKEAEEQIKKYINDIEDLQRSADLMEVRVRQNAFWMRDPLYSRVIEFQKAVVDYASHVKAMAQEQLSMLINSSASEGLKYDFDIGSFKKKSKEARELGERLTINNLTVSEFYRLLKKTALW